jgi:hypothetical protein
MALRTTVSPGGTDRCQKARIDPQPPIVTLEVEGLPVCRLGLYRLGSFGLALQYCVARGSPLKAQGFRVEARLLVSRPRCLPLVCRDGSVFGYSGTRTFGVGLEIDFGFGFDLGLVCLGTRRL